MTEYWQAKTLDDLRSFIDSGLATETRWLEFKQQLPNNRAVAKQLAGFAIAGGAIVFGVAEEPPNRFVVRPIPLAGLRERVEAIAQSLVEPPLWVEPRLLVDGTRDDGVLWIDVPQSPDAPHQVDGTYYERGDSQARPMRDPAVRRLMRERSLSLDRIETYLHDAMAEHARFSWIGRTCVVARPVGAAPQELYDPSGGQADWERFAAEVSRVRSGVCEDGQLREALLGSAQTLKQEREYVEVVTDLQLRLGALTSRSGNWGVLENNRRRGLLSAPRARDYCSLDFEDDGSIRYVTYSEHPTLPYLQPGLSVAACLDVVALLRFIGSKTDKRCLWDIAVGVTETKGRESISLLPDYKPLPTLRFRADTYERSLRVGTARLEQDAWGIARDLSQRFVEGCGLDFDDEARLLGYEPSPEE